MPAPSAAPRPAGDVMPVSKDLAPADVAAEFRDFAYIVSHDLQGPARAMIEMSRFVQQDRETGNVEDEALHLRLIIESGEKLQNMGAGLLAFSRLNSRVWQPQRLEMNALIKAQIDLHAEAFKAAAGHFTASDLPAVYADRVGVERVLGALIDNALKFRRKDKALKLKLSAETTERGIVFCLADNGIGIEPEYSSEIFRPLRKLHTDNEYPGIGMGLTLARKIIMAQGGDIWAKPNAEAGLSVFFTLPQSIPLRGRKTNEPSE